VTRYYLGEFAAARTLLKQCYGLVDPAHVAIVAAMPFAPFPVILGYLALTSWSLGYIDQARSQMNQALSEARRLNHAFTLAHVLALASSIDWLTCPGSLESHAEELQTLSAEHGFSFYLGAANVYRGRLLTAHGQANEGVALLRQELAAAQANGTVLARRIHDVAVGRLT
jgi:hypothetical protein